MLGSGSIAEETHTTLWRTMLIPLSKSMVSSGFTVPLVSLYSVPLRSSTATEDQSAPLYWRAACAAQARKAGRKNLENTIFGM